MNRRTANSADAGQVTAVTKHAHRPGRRVVPRKLVTLFFALVWAIVVVAPLYYMLVVSIQAPSEFMNGNPWLPSGQVTLENYRGVLDSGYLGNLANTFLVASGATVLAVAVSLFASYAIVVRADRLTGMVFQFLLVGFAVPIQALMIPLYVMVIRAQLYDTLLGLILPMAAFSLPITVLILVNFLREVPSSLVSAMQLDGAGPVRILRSLVVPVCMPAIITVSILNLINAWNNFLFPLLLTQSPDRATLPLSVFNFQGNNFSNMPLIMAAVCLSSLPLLVAYVVARRHITNGLAAGFGG